ncbi:CPBP family intramembrane glutamic endopeptidase [Undibacterium sp. YM2]|uniref:CPBP family intramembrane glutamic endopeptidase n=1 Tax=Undibacterium sp. YM2 TaxID=2058625 RepID=UPI001389A57A|nr:CPBP family intramembrane glutamic endopeptidase [Undibacterium sp. YM2]
MLTESGIEPRSFTKIEKLIFLSGLSSILILRIILASYSIEEMPLAGANLLMAFDVIVFALILKKCNLGKSFIVECVLVTAYIFLFGFLLSTLVNLPELFVALEKLFTLKLLVTVAALALAAGILEELLFRKILIDFFLKGMSLKWAVFWSSFAFFFAHFTFNPFMFLAAVAYAYMALRFRSLVAVILLHGLYDFSGFLSMVNVIQQLHLKNSPPVSDLLRGVNGLCDMALVFTVFLFYVSTWIVKNFKTRHTKYTQKWKVIFDD